MRIVSPNKAIAFFITFGAILVLLAVGLNVGWIDSFKLVEKVKDKIMEIRPKRKK